jgi:hypothetical protein
MTDHVLDAICDIIQEDVGGRGLRNDPETNLITACRGDFQRACHSLASTPNAALAIVTGFFIAHAEPPAAETDGPLGAVFLVRALMPLGIHVALVTDPFCQQALQVGLATCGLEEKVPLVILPPATQLWDTYLQRDWSGTFRQAFPVTHLLALERVGPSHTVESLKAQPGTTAEAVERLDREVPPASRDRCFSMRGRDITANTHPAHRLFEAGHRPPVTIGIGDGGNEIGMGKIPWDTIRRNIPRGGLVACRVPVDYLIVCGVSNWGAYGLAAGVMHLRGQPFDAGCFDPARERLFLQAMVERGPLVDGVTGQATVSVDGLDFERYVEPLRRIAALGH